jgi:osmotically-inducible protein OsmY
MHIIVKNGHVTLEGTVMNQMDKTMAGIAANTVPGVFSVENNLRIG